jgi:hypothetical protein
VARLDIGTDTDTDTDTLEVYERNYRGSGAAAMLDALPVATVARMEAEIETLVNDTHFKKSRVYRANVLRMVTGTLDLAVRRHLIPGHQVVGIELKTYRPTAEERAAANAPWVFVTDAQARALAEGITVTRTGKKGKPRTYTLRGIGAAVWLMRCCGARIGEALGAEKADFTEREDGSKVWQLRWQAADDGKSRVVLKHRPQGKAGTSPYLISSGISCRRYPTGRSAPARPAAPATCPTSPRPAAWPRSPPSWALTRDGTPTTCATSSPARKPRPGRTSLTCPRPWATSPRTSRSAATRAACPAAWTG